MGKYKRNWLVDFPPWSGAKIFRIFTKIHRGYLRQTLVFGQNSALREKINVYFSAVVCNYWQNFGFGEKTGELGFNYMKFGIFLIFPNFLSLFFLSNFLIFPSSATRNATCVYHVYYFVLCFTCS